MLSPRGRRAVVLAAALLGAAVTARLAVWQLSRADQKTTLQQAIDERGALLPLPAAGLARSAEEAALQHQRRVTLQGRWLPQHTVFLENRQMHGQPGFYVVTPLELAPGEAVLVQRGWVPRDPRERTRLPAVATPAGPLAVEGRIAPPPARLYQFDGAGSGPIRQNLDLAAYGRETGLSLRPLSVQQLAPAAGAAAPDGLQRDWPRPAVDVHKHLGYAFQWFALCALITGLYVWFQLLRPRLAARRHRG